MVPWATLALVALNVAVFWHPIKSPQGACLSVQAVWGQGQWYRLLLAPFHHLSVCHLLMNMATLFWLGRGMEQDVGTTKTGLVLLSLALIGGLLHLALNAMLAAATGHQWYWEHCAMGFSGGPPRATAASQAQGQLFGYLIPTPTLPPCLYNAALPWCPLWQESSSRWKPWADQWNLSQ